MRALQVLRRGGRLPLCVKTQDVDEFVQTVYNISSSFGGINLEDIAAPRCFEIERKLKEKCDIPVFHDDQHGTAIIALAKPDQRPAGGGQAEGGCEGGVLRAGSAAISITKLLLQAGFRDITLCDKFGALYEGNPNMNWAQQEIARRTNLEKKQGTLADLMVGADVFIGVSAPNLVTPEMVSTMNRDAIVFACANPTPEIFPDDARAGGARVVATGRSDYPNQINNVLAFPGIFRGALDVRASDINEEMKMAAAMALASVIPGGGAVRGEHHPQALRSPEWSPPWPPPWRRPPARPASPASFLERKLGKELPAKLRFASGFL